MCKIYFANVLSQYGWLLLKYIGKVNFFYLVILTGGCKQIAPYFLLQEVQDIKINRGDMRLSFVLSKVMGEGVISFWSLLNICPPTSLSNWIIQLLKHGFCFFFVVTKQSPDTQAATSNKQVNRLAVKRVSSGDTANCGMHDWWRRWKFALQPL